VLLAALEAGVTLFDTAALYGFGVNETLVGRVLKAHRSRIVLCSKGGMAGVTFPDGSIKRVIDGRPEGIRRDCEASLARLGTDVIDLYYLHRFDKLRPAPIEDSVGEMARLKAEGKIRSRCAFSTRPTSVSLTPKPYSAAVSKSVTPASSAASSTRSACAGGGGAP